MIFSDNVLKYLIASSTLDILLGVLFHLSDFNPLF